MSACDQGTPTLEPGRVPLHVVATYPADGDGLDCATTDPACGVPVDTSIEIAFDRFVLPATAVRQSLSLSSGGAGSCRIAGAPSPDVCFEPKYDVVERVVSFRLVPGARLLPGVLYTAELVMPGDEQPFGFRAFDGASIAETDKPLRFSFRTSSATSTPAPPEAVPDCTHVLGIFARPSGAAGSPPTCAGGNCHSKDEHRMGLRLDSAFGLVTTAIGKVAHETDLAPHAGEPIDNPPRFGLEMPVIDPGRPDTSYLLYKLLVNDRNYAGCTTHYPRLFPDGACAPPSAEERERLREWFVRGQPMPLREPADAPGWNVTADDIRDIQRFIAGGASTAGCH